jgi:hypothetical protein
MKQFTCYSVQGTRYTVHGTRCRVHCTRCAEHGTVFQIHGDHGGHSGQNLIQGTVTRYMVNIARNTMHRAQCM